MAGCFEAVSFTTLLASCARLTLKANDKEQEISRTLGTYVTAYKEEERHAFFSCKMCVLRLGSVDNMFHNLVVNH